MSKAEVHRQRRSFRFVEHTADIAFEAWGEDLTSLLRAAAAAWLKATVNNPRSVRRRVRRKVKLEAPAADLVLFALLQELVFFKDAEHLLLHVGRLEPVEHAGGWRLTAELEGEEADPARHDLRADIKAVTLHQFRLEQVDGKWRCYVILDV